MKYNYRKGDKVFFKAIMGMSHIPLEKDEVLKLANALKEGKEGVMFFRMGIADISKISAIVPDYERMEDWNVNDEKIELPDIGAMLLKETPQDLDTPRIGKVAPIKELLPPTL